MEHWFAWMSVRVKLQHADLSCSSWTGLYTRHDVHADNVVTLYDSALSTRILLIVCIPRLPYIYAAHV